MAAYYKSNKYYLMLIMAILLVLTVWANADQAPAVKAPEQVPKQTSEHIKVMVMDTGIDVSHPVFEGRSISCADPKDCRDLINHGTHVASLVVNGELDAGFMPMTKVCPQVKIVSCNYLRTASRASMYECLKLAEREQVYLVNFSADGKDLDQVEYLLIKNLETANIKFITATGNEGLDLTLSPRYPAMYANMEYISDIFSGGLRSLSNVIAVAGIDRNGQPYEKSNTAPYQQVMLATNVRSAYTNGIYGTYSGTSMATALYSNKLLNERCKELGYE